MEPTTRPSDAYFSILFLGQYVTPMPQKRGFSKRIVRKLNSIELKLRVVWDGGDCSARCSLSEAVILKRKIYKHKYNTTEAKIQNLKNNAGYAISHFRRKKLKMTQITVFTDINIIIIVL